MRKIFVNGVIYSDSPGMTGFVCEDETFLYVGCDEEALSYREADSEVIDLRGRFAAPGFNDSHMHLISLGNSLNMVDLYGADSVEDMVSRGKEFIQGKQFYADHFIMGFGWNDDYFKEKRFINRYDLDRITTEYPICFIRACYHVYVVNSKALELLGIDENTRQVDGGAFDVDEAGKPLGIFRENACDLVAKNITPLEQDEIQQCIMDGIAFCNRMGITSIGTDDLSEFNQVPYDEILAAFQKLEAEGKLKARINQQARFHSFEEFQKFLQEGYRTGTGSDRFRIGPLKLITDGSLGARTAFLKEPYADDPSTCGLWTMNQEELDTWVRTGHENHMQIAAHAIGDGAVQMVIDAYQKILDGPNEFRHGIVHTQIIEDGALEEMIRLNLLAYIQTIFLDYDVTIAENRLGDRAKWGYRFASMVRRGVPISNGSDAPVEWPDVMKGIQLGVTRKSITNQADAFDLEEALTVKEAIDSFTKGGAYATFEEEKKGRMEEGKLADFVILSEDLMSVEPERIKDVRVLETWVGGTCVWHDETER